MSRSVRFHYVDSAAADDRRALVEPIDVRQFAAMIREELGALEAANASASKRTASEWLDNLVRRIERRGRS